MKNKIEMKPSEYCNVELFEVFINNKFYTAIVGIKFDDKRGHYTKYRFIHDNLHSLIEPNECPVRLFNSLRAEILDLDTCKLPKLLFKY